MRLTDTYLSIPRKSLFYFIAILCAGIRRGYKIFMFLLLVFDIVFVLQIVQL